eukprot:3966820-Amphidinium_carterae.2
MKSYCTSNWKKCRASAHPRAACGAQNPGSDEPSDARCLLVARCCGMRMSSWHAPRTFVRQNPPNHS